jgi:hypothetical protein
LNELDGFAANVGIVALATTNHPERLDPSILDRPSRFDRKYPFDLPELPKRHAYISMWNVPLKPQLQLVELALIELCSKAFGGCHSIAFLHQIGDFVPFKLDIEPDSNPTMMTNIWWYEEPLRIRVHKYILNSCGSFAPH